MTTQTDGTPTPQEVETHATQAVRLDPVALIGTFGTDTAPQALILLPRGKTQTVAIGDDVAGGTVEAIDADHLILSRMGEQQILRMPRG